MEIAILGEGKINLRGWIQTWATSILDNIAGIGLCSFLSAESARRARL